MPVEIREIVIQARIVGDGEETSPDQAPPAALPQPGHHPGDDAHEMRLQILTECERMIRQALADRDAR